MALPDGRLSLKPHPTDEAAIAADEFVDFVLTASGGAHFGDGRLHQSALEQALRVIRREVASSPLRKEGAALFRRFRTMMEAEDMSLDAFFHQMDTGDGVLSKVGGNRAYLHAYLHFDATPFSLSST